MIPQTTPTTVRMGHESPSLTGSADPAAPAYELKFFLPDDQAREVEARLRGHLAPDPHADPTLGGGYRVTSVYFDTPGFDVYRRADGFAVHKHRVRRYGSAPVVFLERKSKQSGRVWKRRTAVPAPEAAHLTEHGNDWAGAWFVRELAERGLRPVCRVAYDRVALVGRSPTGATRVTLDRAVRGQPWTGSRVDPFADGVPLLTGGVVVEFKYLSALPPLFKEVIEALRLTPRGASKYRRCAEAAGLVAGDPADA